MGKETRYSADQERERFVTRRMVVKIGSNAITAGASEGEPLNLPLINEIARQCSELYKKGVEVIIVSSGAVASGKNLSTMNGESITDRQVLSAIGQPKLIEKWVQAFETHGILAAQVLLTERDLRFAKPVILNAIKHCVVIINANDAVSKEELDELMISADNDRLAEFVTMNVDADTLVILTDVKGVLKDNQLIEDGLSIDIDEFAFVDKSEAGTRGMKPKVQVMNEISHQGKTGVIAAAHEPDIILRIARGEMEKIGTVFAAKG